MKKYLIVVSVLACVACNNTQKAEERGREAANRENEIRQRTIDSLEMLEANHHHSSSTNNSSGTDNNVNEQNNNVPAKKKGMSNTTKGALIGTGAGVAAGAATGAAVSKDKGKGAIIGGVVGGAVGSGVGYGVGAHKDKKAKEAQDSAK